jgi:hypothetical protein
MELLPAAFLLVGICNHDYGVRDFSISPTDSEINSYFDKLSMTATAHCHCEGSEAIFSLTQKNKAVAFINISLSMWRGMMC